MRIRQFSRCMLLAGAAWSATGGMTASAAMAANQAPEAAAADSEKKAEKR